ncbi:MAG: RDD family protein [Gammaproteobacteria bacterium]|nr:RDD family protein [Gammaproteobacteria bacterium]
MAPVSGVSAGLLRRLGAMLYDTLLVLAMWLATLFPIVAVNNSPVNGAAVQSVLFVELFAFFAYFWVARGQTLGMLAWRVHLVSVAGTGSKSKITLKQAQLRFVGALASFLTLGVGYLWILVDAKGRAWPDLLSKTRVLYVPK